MIKFLVGLIVGGMLGVMISAIFIASSNADDAAEKKMK